MTKVNCVRLARRVPAAVALTALAALFSASGAGEPVPQNPPPASGQEGEKDKDKDGGRLKEIVVTAERTGLPGVQAVVEAGKADAARRSGGAEGLLGGMAGVELSRKSFAGSDSGKVRIRGLDESRSLILMDGRSLHGAGVYGGYYVDWSSLSLEEIERVEIIRGAGPARYGNTLGGTINVVTRRAGDEPRTEIRAAGGNLGTWSAEASHAGAVGRVSYSLAASHYETDGYLRNAYADREAFAGRLAVTLPAEVEVSAGLRFTGGHCGMIVYNNPDSPYYDPRKPRSLESQLGGPYVMFWDHGAGAWGPRDWGDGSYWLNRRWQFDWGVSREGEDFGFEVKAYLLEEERREFFYAMDDPQHLVLQRDSRPEEHNWGWRGDFHNEFEFAGRHRVEYGLEGHYLGYGDMDVQSVDPTYFPAWGLPAPSDGDHGISALNGGYAENTWEVGDWLEVRAGLRFDGFRADGPESNAITVDEKEWSPRLAVTVRPWEGGHLTARYARACRFPTLPEYYWWYSGYQPADRDDLTSEKANQCELEVGHRVAEKFEVVVRGYYYDVEDYIRTIFGYMPSRVVYNIDRVYFRGLELEGSCRLPAGFAVRGSWTLQKTGKHGDVLDLSSELSDELVELPENRFRLGLDYSRESGLEARLVLSYLDARHAVRGSSAIPGASTLEKMEGHVGLDLSASCPLFRGRGGEESRVFLSVENLLDDPYEEEYGYPLPGITFTVGLVSSF